MNSNTPKYFFSIYTPVYNRAHNINKLYNSLKNQSFKDFQWIIVDDGSTDNIKKEVDKIRSFGKIQITFLSHPINLGKHIASKSAQKIAEGLFFLNLDSDDIPKKCLRNIL